MTAPRFHLGLGLNAFAHRQSLQNGHVSLRESVLAADAAGIDFVTLDDTFGEAGEAGAPARSLLDAVLFASLLAPLTRTIGLIPVTDVSFREPFHLSTAIATLDHASRGRAGWQPRVPSNGSAAAVALHTGSVVYGLDYTSPETLTGDATDVVEVARRLWDSWEDGAIVRDVATGRFIDRARLHYVDFEGANFSVRGPSIVPRPPQGQPVVAIRVDDAATLSFAAAQADLVFFDADTAQDACAWLERVRASGIPGVAARTPPQAYADLTVAFGEHAARELVGAPAPLFRGSPAELAAYLDTLAQRGVVGARLHPFDPGHDVEVIVNAVLPALRASGRAGACLDGTRLRERLDLPAAPNRYACVNPEASVA